MLPSSPASKKLHLAKSRKAVKPRESLSSIWLAADVERERIPAPRLHGFGLRGDKSNDVGVAYMLIDKLPGRPFEPHAATAEQTAKVLDQWAGMLCELGQHPLDQVGSLTFEAGEGGYGPISVGPVASDRTGTLPCTLGPFSDARSFYAAWADAHLDAISDGQLCSAHPVDAYLMFRWIKDQMAAADGRTTSPGGWASLMEAEGLHKGPFVLRHVDDKGDHLLVDDDYNITGVIDWTFARTAPVYEAFAPALVTGDTSSLFSGTPGISATDRCLEQALQRHGAPYFFFDADPMRRLLLGIGVGLGLTLSETIAVFQCIVSTWSGGAETIPDWSAWRTAQLARYHPYRDARLAAILRHERPPPPRFTTCAFPAGCDRPGVRKSRCPVCNRHLCALHWRPQYHTCKPLVLDDDAWDQTLTDEVEALLAQLNIPALERRASAIRDGVPCQFRRAKHLGADSTMGCANYNAWIIFADGVRWVARLPRTTDGSDAPADFVDYLVASE